MYDNVRKPESDWYEAGYTAPRTDTAGIGCYDSYWSPSQAAAPKKKPHQGLKITMIDPVPPWYHLLSFRRNFTVFCAACQCAASVTVGLQRGAQLFDGLFLDA